MTLPAYLALSSGKTALSALGRGASTGFRYYNCDLSQFIYMCCYMFILFSEHSLLRNGLEPIYSFMYFQRAQLKIC